MFLTLLQTDPNWPPQAPTPFRGITRRFILGMALLSCAVVLLGLPLVQVFLAIVTPAPFEYRDVPFTVCSTRSTADHCDPLQPNDAFHPGDVVPFIASRCAQDIFARSTVLPYVVSRNLVNSDTGVRTILPSLATETPLGGCMQSLTFAHQLPEAVAPGRYYFEGVATAYGRWRTVNAYFRTADFAVVRS